MAKDEHYEFPCKINGIYFESEEEYKARIESDALALANLLYDIYKEKLAKDETNNHNQGSPQDTGREV